MCRSSGLVVKFCVRLSNRKYYKQFEVTKKESKGETR